MDTDANSLTFILKPGIEASRSRSVCPLPWAPPPIGRHNFDCGVLLALDTAVLALDKAPLLGPAGVPFSSTVPLSIIVTSNACTLSQVEYQLMLINIIKKFTQFLYKYMVLSFVFVRTSDCCYYLLEVGVMVLFSTSLWESLFSSFFFCDV